MIMSMKATNTKLNTCRATNEASPCPTPSCKHISQSHTANKLQANSAPGLTCPLPRQSCPHIAEIQDYDCASTSSVAVEAASTFGLDAFSSRSLNNTIAAPTR